MNDGVLKEKARFVGTKRDVTHGENGGGCGIEEWIFFGACLATTPPASQKGIMKAPVARPAPEAIIENVAGITTENLWRDQERERSRDQEIKRERESRESRERERERVITH